MNFSTGARRLASLACLGAAIVCGSLILAAQNKIAGRPEDHLPSNITPLTAFGERAGWSPDGSRIAFMGKSFGDAFEIDLKTKLVRLLTGHFHHEGFLRVQFLPNGDYFLIGARHFQDIRTTRGRDQEMWVMKADLKSPPVALSQRISEGVAISRKRMKIAWANTHEQVPDALTPGESASLPAPLPPPPELRTWPCTS